MNKPNDEKPIEPQGPNEQFEQSAKALFDESVDNLDAATLSKLNQGRQAALAAAADAPRLWLRWVPAAGMATAVLVAVLVVRGPGMVDVPYAASPMPGDFEMLMGDDALEMIEELDFYSWMDVAEADATDNVG
jgi:hypothetical protein